jgi:hypothetical protein
MPYDDSYRTPFEAGRGVDVEEVFLPKRDMRQIFTISFLAAVAMIIIPVGMFAPVISLALAAVAAAIFLFEKHYDKYMRPIKLEIKNLTNVKTGFLPPKPFRSLHRRLKATVAKMWPIEKKIKKLNETIQALDEHEDLINVKRPREIKENIGNYYDDYCSLALYLKFQFYIEMITKILLKRKQIYKIDVTDFTGKLKENMKEFCDELTSSGLGRTYYKHFYEFEFKRYKLSIPKSISSIATKEEYERLHREIHPNSGVLKKYALDYKKTKQTMKKINGDIKLIIKYLIAIQSGELIGGASAAEDENVSEIHRIKNETKQAIDLFSSLDRSYAKFAAELPALGN